MGLFIGSRSAYSDRSEEWGNGGNVTAHLSSKSDPRWNCSWRCQSIWNAGHEREVERLTKMYGPPPDDLEFVAMKD